MADTVDWRAALDRALDGVGVWPVFQPIVDLRRRVVVGYEALSRFDDAVVAARPDVWFRRAAALGVGADLEALTMRTALEHRRSLPANCFLSLNVDPDNLRSPAVSDVLAAHDDLRGVVIELTEHHDWDWDHLACTVQVLRDRGARLALDDAGTGHSGLRQMLQLRPSFLKLDRQMISGIDRDEAKIAMVEMVGTLADRLDAWVLAEGVETLDEARCLQRLGVPLVQGWFFGRPGQAWPPIDRRAVESIAAPEALRGPGLQRLVDPVPAGLVGEPVPPGWTARHDAWRPVVDRNRRPVGLVHAGSSGSPTPVEVLVVNIGDSPHQVAMRLATSGHRADVPVAVTDDCGRYVGLVRLPRLLAHLGSGSPAPPAAPGGFDR